MTPIKLWEPVASGWRGPGAFGQNSSLVSRGGRLTLPFSRVQNRKIVVIPHTCCLIACFTSSGQGHWTEGCVCTYFYI